MSSDWAAKAKSLYMELCSVMHSGDAYRRGNEIILAALRDAARVPEGYVRTADGVDRKVLGTLPITADGCVVGAGEGSRTWTMTEDGVSSFACADGWYRHRYSTREAAEAALAQPTPARGEGEP